MKPRTKNRSRVTMTDRNGMAGSPRWFMAAAILLISIASWLLTHQPITDSDFWHHLSFGRILIEEGRFPQGDELSSTAAGRPWISSGWLPSVALYMFYRVSGGEGAQDLVQGVVFVAAMLLFSHCNLRGKRSEWNCLITLLALAAASPRFLPRPDVFSVGLIVPLMMLLIWYENDPLSLHSRRRTIWRALLLPGLFLVWANCHMLFVIGFAIAALFTGWALLECRKGRRDDGAALVMALAVAGVACLATPYGWSAAWFILENARLNDTGSRINELKPFWSAVGKPGTAVIMTAAAAWAVVSGWMMWRCRRAGFGWWRWAVAAFLICLMLIQRRQIGIAVFGITPLVIACASGAALPRALTGRLAFLWPVAIFVLLVLDFRENRSWEVAQGGIDCDWYPCEAVGFLKENPPPEKLFHDLYTGSYLGYQLAPETKVFIDGRLEVYNNGTYDDFFAPPEGRMKLLDLFEKYDVNSVLLDWRLAGQAGHTATVLAGRPDWRLCWFSDHYALFVHAEDSTAAYTAAHGYRYLNPLFPEGFTNALADPATGAAARAEARRALADDPDGHLANMAMTVAGIQGAE